MYTATDPDNPRDYLSAQAQHTYTRANQGVRYRRAD
jgi:hypothetical protein